MNHKKQQYIMPTPGGAYYLVQDGSDNWRKNVLKCLFSAKKSLPLNHETLSKIFETGNKENLQYKIEKCKQLKLIQVIDEEVSAPAGQLEESLNQFIAKFSQIGHVLLSDSQGFCITNHGFPHEMSEEISVLSADIAIMHKRRAVNINKKLSLNSQAWSIVDASGNSCLGFWPININNEVFVLTIEGVPFFNQAAMVSLVWTLYLRYGNK
ncbi:MAG TPA: hypothetical protein ENK52_06030 [Saprospiraceae bacterium]|nr:hypothetical protein [Saprospiraceae bacterium]